MGETEVGKGVGDRSRGGGRMGEKGRGGGETEVGRSGGQAKVFYGDGVGSDESRESRGGNGSGKEQGV